jgi:2-phosphosulfolactate phosphatase
MIFDQSEYNVRCEWGEKGVSLLAPTSDCIVIVDVLSFSTSVEIATNRGALVYPYRWRDEAAYQFAQRVGAEVADKKNASGYRLSPSSLEALPSGIRLVIPSPNGSHLSFSAGASLTIAGCLRNCRAVAEYGMTRGKNIAIIPAGERWEDGTLRPCFEDWVGAGAIISHLGGTLSPEAKAAMAVFNDASSNLLERLRSCSSGKEKISRAEERDLVLASELNASDCVPVLVDGAYRRADR